MPQLADDARLRRALALAGRSRILLQPCDLSLEFLLHDSVRTDLRDRALWLGIAQGSAIDPRTLRIAAGKIMLRDNVTPAVVAGRLSLDVGAMRTCIDQPNIIQYRRMLQVAADGAIAESRAVDLAFTSCAAIGVGADGFRARIGKGVADTWAEFMALGAGSRADENAATLFESASSTSAAPVILRPAAAAPDLSALRMPPDARERLRADLSGGNVVVAFGAKDRWGWWRIDPHTGQTVGVMDNGLNGAMTDREILENDMVLLSEELGEPITENGLRNASESELRRLAAKAKSVSPDRMFMDLQQMQREIWGCDMQGLIRGSGMRG